MQKSDKHIRLGKHVKIWRYCNVYGTRENPVIILDDTQIGSYSEIKPGVHIGHHCRLQSSVFVSDGSRIGNYVFIGPHVIFLNDKYPTAISASNGTWNNTPVSVGDYAVIGGGAVIGPGVNIGRGACVGMGAVITKNVKPGEIVAGNPARVIGKTTDRKFKSKFLLPSSK